MMQAQTQTIQVGEHLLTLRDLGPEDGAQLLALHRLVFGPEADEQWLAWKYGQGTAQGRGLGCGVWHGRQLIAHCGGLPRTLWRQGQRTQGLQIGDVMVAPLWRGILTRRGPFFHASQAFYERQVGNQQAHQMAYGFPSERHLKLAVTLKLLWDGGPIHALTWRTTLPPASRPALGWRWTWQALDPSDAGFDNIANASWQDMLAAHPQLMLGERNAAYLRWRYAQRPGNGMQRYRFFSLRQRWSRRVAGIAVLALQAPQTMWLDWIGPAALLPTATQACKWQAASGGATSLCLWASPAVAQALDATGIDVSAVTAGLGIPRASVIEQRDIPHMNWWLMGGDTDFL